MSQHPPSTDPEPLKLPGPHAEYLEKIVSDGFKREFDQEENVVRSLPFFATSIGVLVAFIGLAREAFPPFAWGVFPVAIYVLLTAIIVCLGVLLWLLWRAVGHHFDAKMSDEQDWVAYGKQMEDYYSEAADAAAEEEASDDPATEADENMKDGPDVVKAAIGELVKFDMRQRIIEQTAAAAVARRNRNAERITARTKAFVTLLIALGFALALLVAILLNEALNGVANDQTLEQPQEQSGSAHSAPTERAASGQEGQPPGETKTTEDASGREGGVVSKGDSSR